MKRVGFYFENRSAFTAALFDAWAEGTQVWLLPDALPVTVAAVRGQIDGFAGDADARSLDSTRGEGAFSTSQLKADSLVLFTSGSTGAPVAVTKYLRQLFDEVHTLEHTFGHLIPPEARFVSTVSHQHIYGLLTTVLWPALTKRQLTPTRIDYPEPLEEALSAHPCVLISSPAHLKRLPEGRAWNTKVTAVFSSGGPLDAEASDRALAILGHRPIELYGSTETGGIAWRQGPSNPWKLLRGIEVRRSVDDTLELKSPHLPTTEWFTTADRVELTGDTFRLLGRADRIAKIEETRVSLETIERLAVETGLLKEARAVPLEGARVTLGLVGVRAPAGLSLAKKDLVTQLKTAIAQGVTATALPRKFRFVEAPAQEWRRENRHSRGCARSLRPSGRPPRGLRGAPRARDWSLK